MNDIKLVATCMLGVEGLLSDELKRMGANNVIAENGRVLFDYSEQMLCRANIKSRYAERILLLMGEFKVFSFEELYEKTKAISWEKIINKNDKFPVTGRSLNSKLASVPDCQKIIKKAIVDKLSNKYKIIYFDETDTMYQIRFLLFNDKISIMVDTSGVGLHKRSYRAVSGDAPIKETLAAAMADISRVRPYHKVYDPFCGSGTILIEAAMKALNIAPGINRGFVSEDFNFISSQVWSDERELAKSEVLQSNDFIAFGSDIDPKVLEIAKANAQKAGVADKIIFKRADIKDFSPETETGTLICNPPYGERLLTIKDAANIYKICGEKFINRRGWSYTIISPEDDFERYFGRRADKRRKLYNGMIKCQVYMYFKNKML